MSDPFGDEIFNVFEEETSASRPSPIPTKDSQLEEKKLDVSDAKRLRLRSTRIDNK